MIYNTNKGFTLIELIIVIVILGILAVTAAPRFIDISTDATIAKLESLSGTLKSATALAHAKAVIQGKTNGSNSIDVGNDSINLSDGYPTASWSTSLQFMIELDEVVNIGDQETCETSWCATGLRDGIWDGPSTPTAEAKVAKIYPKGYRLNDQCGIYYMHKADGSVPEIGIQRNC